MSSARGERLQTYCKIIWGEFTYDIDIETDDWTHYMAFVREDLGFKFGSVLALTGCCNSPDHAWRELDRMLGQWARQKLSGKPMTRDQRLEIFGGPNGRNKAILERVYDVLDRRELGSASKKT